MKTQYLSLTIAHLNEKIQAIELTGTEGLSIPFVFRITIISTNSMLQNLIKLNSSALITIHAVTHSPYYFHGNISQIIAEGQKYGDELWVYQLQLESWFGLLQKNLDCEAFVNKSLVEIIQSVFVRYQCNDYDISKLKNNYPTINYCVRYQESAYDFIYRLLCEYGIYYYFSHTKNKHVLNLEDSDIPSVSSPKGLIYQNEKGGDDAHCHHWQAFEDHFNTSLQTRAFDFHQPSQTIGSHSCLQTKNRLPLFREYYFFTESLSSTTQQILQQQLRQQCQAKQAASQSVTVDSNYLGLTPGQHIKIRCDDDKRVNGDFYIVQIEHSAKSHQRLDATAQQQLDSLDVYINKLTALPLKNPFKLLNTCSKPKVASTLLGIVTGPNDSKIYTNKYAEVKVQSHWDRFGNYNETSSDWMRVRQSFAGNQWGAQFLPRVGHEVLLYFAYGNPEQPVVYQSLYNINHIPSFSLPGNKSQSGFKTKTFAEEEGGHELRFDDKPNAEEIYLNSHKDHTIYVKGNANKIVSQHSNTVIQQGSYSLKTTGTHQYHAGYKLHFKVGSSEIILDEDGVHLHADRIAMDN